MSKATGSCQSLGDLVKVRIPVHYILLCWILTLPRVADGQWSEEDIYDPLGQMITLLSELKDRELVHKWGLWLVKRVPEAGLKVDVLCRGCILLILLTDNS